MTNPPSIATLIATMMLVVSVSAGSGDSLETDLRWHSRVQVAGFQGLVSLGGGPIFFKGIWRPALMYGYAPPASGITAVHQIILHNSVVLRQRPTQRPWWVAPALSVNIMLETGEHTYLSLPDRFPSGYYRAPQAHGTLGLGAHVNRSLKEAGLFRQITLSTELVGLDTHIWYAISERGVPFYKAFGLSFAFAVAW